VAAADTDGHVSFWNANRDASKPSDGVHLHRPVRQGISGLRWGLRSTDALFCASYDGTVRCLNVEMRAFETLHVSKEHVWSAFALDGAAATMWLGTNVGSLCAVDPRTGLVCEKVVRSHGLKINSLSLDDHGRPWLLASSSSDASVKVWDVRNMGARAGPVVTIALPKATQAAEWAPDGSGRLAVTCFDDHLRILPLGDRIMGDPISAPEAEPLINHRTSTGRWLLPFRAIWTAGVCSSAGLLKLTGGRGGPLLPVPDSPC